MHVRTTTLRYVAVACLWAATALVGCSKNSSADDLAEVGAGSVGLALTAGGVEIKSITYHISANSFTKDGTIPVNSSGTSFSALIVGIPPGQGYTITLNAATSCMGSAMFNVTAAQTTPVTIHLQCAGSHKTGSIMVNGSLNVCPVVDAAGADSLDIVVGAPVTLTTSASDEDSGPAALTYAWTAAGTIAVKVAVSDSDCGDSTTLSLRCTASAGAAGSGTAGTGAAGSAGATAGTGGAPASCPLGSGCHNVDPGSGRIHDCHEVGHSGDAAMCQANLASCTQLCGAAQCTAVVSACAGVDPGTGPLHDCRQLGLNGDATACFNGGRACVTACQAAASAGSGGASGLSTQTVFSVLPPCPPLTAAVPPAPAFCPPLPAAVPALPLPPAPPDGCPARPAEPPVPLEFSRPPPPPDCAALPPAPPSPAFASACPALPDGPAVTLLPPLPASACIAESSWPLEESSPPQATTRTIPTPAAATRALSAMCRTQPMCVISRSFPGAPKHAAS
jgi:hypothetical protein